MDVTRHELEGAGNVRFTADGALLAIVEAGLVRIERTKTPKPTKLLAIAGGGPIAVSGDRSRAFVGDGKKLHALELKAKKPRTLATMTVNGDGVMGIAASRDGGEVLVAGNDEGGILKHYDVGKPRARYTIG